MKSGEIISPDFCHMFRTNSIGFTIQRKGVVIVAYENGGAPHHVMLEERKRLTVSGVEDVERFDENTIVLSATQGAMTVSGENLHIEKLSLDGGDLKVEGNIESLVYEDGQGDRGGFFARLMR